MGQLHYNILKHVYQWWRNMIGIESLICYAYIIICTAYS